MVAGLPGAASAAGEDPEADSARGAGAAGVVTAGERTAVPVFSEEAAVGEGSITF